MAKTIVVADSTQIQAFDICERIWHYGHLLRLQPSSAKEKISDAKIQGTFGHKLLERYYKNRANSVPNAIETAFDFDPDKEMADKDGGPFPLPLTDRQFIKQKCREYTYTNLETDIIPCSADTVEIGFSKEIYEDDEFLFVLEGRIDMIGTHSTGMRCVVDHKFQLRKRDLYKKSIQFKNYALATDVRLVVINYIRLTKKSDHETFERALSPFSAPELSAWRLELIEIMKRMGRAKRDGTYRPSWSACEGKFGYHCDFTNLCEESQDPAFIQTKIDTLYTIKEEFKPW